MESRHGVSIPCESGADSGRVQSSQPRTIKLVPVQSAIIIGNRKPRRETAKGKYYVFRYYVGFERKNISGHFTDSEAERIIKRIENEMNKPTDVFEILPGDLTEDIIRNFRLFVQPVDYEKQKVLIDPYILGVWLGDGDSRRPTLTNIDIPVIDAWCNFAKECGLDVRTDIQTEKREKLTGHQTDHTGCYHIVRQRGKEVNGPTGLRGKNPVKEMLRGYDLINNKHIPQEYLKNDEDTRLRVLAGLIDTDGHQNQGSYEITQKNKRLSENIVEICESLGFYTEMNEVEKSCTYKGEMRAGKYYKIAFHPNHHTPPVPVLIKRKKILDRKIYNYPVIDIEGNIVSRSERRSYWTEDMKIMLYSIVAKIRSLLSEEKSQRIPWRYIIENFDIFRNFSVGALSVMYSKTLTKKTEHYDDLKIEIKLTRYQLTSDNWKNMYEEIKSMIINKEKIKMGDKKRYNWLHEQANRRDNIFHRKLAQELINDNRLL